LFPIHFGYPENFAEATLIAQKIKIRRISWGCSHLLFNAGDPVRKRSLYEPVITQPAVYQWLTDRVHRGDGLNYPVVVPREM
jgi:hypothetical protein